MTKISVLTTVYNESVSQVLRSITSVKQQSHSGLYVEHIVIIDNPKYRYTGILNKFRDEYKTNNYLLKIIVNKKNIGLAQSLNKAIENSSFELVARLDADDWMNDNRLLQQSDMLKMKNYDVIYTDTYIHESKNVEPKYVQSVSGKYINSLLPLRNFIPHSSVMFKKSAIVEVGLYRDLVPAEDYDLWLRLMNNRKRFLHIAKPLTSREIRMESISNSDLNLQIRMANFVRAINKKNHTKFMKLSDKPKKLDDHIKLNYINKKIKQFRTSSGIKKIIIGLSSYFILKTSITDMVYKLKLWKFRN